MTSRTTKLLATSCALAALAAFGPGCAASDAASAEGDMAAGQPRDVPQGDATQPPDANEPVDVTPEFSWFQLSPDDSTSMASAQLLKGAGSYGYYDYSSFPLFPHEVINYYDPPQSLRDGEQVAVAWTTPDGLFVGVDAERTDAQDREREALELMVHVFAPAVDVEERRPWTLHLCVDVSGSMAGDKIVYARNALQLLVDALRPGDQISLTTFDTTGRVVLEPLDAVEDEERIRGAIAALVPGGSTNMIEGLRLAYDLAQASYDPGAINRVIVFSDGNANVGDTDLESFAALTRINNQEGIYLSGVGVGFDYAVERMDALTDAGKGAHVFLPDPNEVGVIFGQMVRKLVEVAADEVSIEVQLPASFELERFSGEEVSTDPDARVPNVVLAAGDDMTLLSSFVTDRAADFEGELILTVRYRPLATAEEVVFERRLPLAELLGRPAKLMQRTRLVNDYARYAAGRDADVNPAELHARVSEFDPQDEGLAEIACMIGYLSGFGGAPDDANACTPVFPDYMYDEGCDMYGHCDGPYYGHYCSAIPAVAINAAWALPLLGGLALLGRRRRG